MLSHDEVIELHQKLGGRRALSVYLNAGETDPAERLGWRVRLHQMIRDLREEHETSPAEERESLDDAIGLILRELRQYEGRLPERGWVGFATPDRLWWTGSSPAPVTDRLRWDAGVDVAPYVRALKQSRPVTVVLADQRRARTFLYLYGDLNATKVLHAAIVPFHRSPPGGSKRAANRSGMRGEARETTAQRLREASRRRLLREIVATLRERRHDDGLVVLAGAAEITGSIFRSLSDDLRRRTIEVPGLPVDATEAELKDAVEAAASTLSARLQRELVDEVIDTTRSAGRGCLGWTHTERALRAGAVDTLVLSRALSTSDPDLAYRLVGMAIQQAAQVEEIAEAVADQLDREGGIGARLRFAV